MKLFKDPFRKKGSFILSGTNYIIIAIFPGLWFLRQAEQNGVIEKKSRPWTGTGYIEEGKQD